MLCCPQVTGNGSNDFKVYWELQQEPEDSISLHHCHLLLAQVKWFSLDEFAGTGNISSNNSSLSQTTINSDDYFLLGASVLPDIVGVNPIDSSFLMKITGTLRCNSVKPGGYHHFGSSGVVHGFGSHASFSSINTSPKKVSVADYSIPKSSKISLCHIMEGSLMELSTKQFLRKQLH